MRRRPEEEAWMRSRFGPAAAAPMWLKCWSGKAWGRQKMPTDVGWPEDTLTRDRRGDWEHCFFLTNFSVL